MHVLYCKCLSVRLRDSESIDYAPFRRYYVLAFLCKDLHDLHDVPEGNLLNSHDGSCRNIEFIRRLIH